MPKGSNKPLMSKKPRDRILDTATRLFCQEGIQTVGVNLIIAEADVAPMTLYRQFGSKDELVAEALEHWSTEWLHKLHDAIDRCGDDPDARFAGLWETLEHWFATADFYGSFVANAAMELRSRPDHPAQRVIREHRMAMRQLLEELAKMAGADDPAGLSVQLQVLIDGAIAAALIDRRPAVAVGVRGLGNVALASAST
jgi:AcrR family transcriptional regulator